jgi:hypothetical protein
MRPLRKLWGQRERDGEVFPMMLDRKSGSLGCLRGWGAPGIVRTKFHEGTSAEQKRHNEEHRIPLHRGRTPDSIDLKFSRGRQWPWIVI